MDPGRRTDARADAEIFRDRGQQGIEPDVPQWLRLSSYQQEQRMPVLLRPTEELEHQPEPGGLVRGGGDRIAEVREPEHGKEVRSGI